MTEVNLSLPKDVTAEDEDFLGNSGLLESGAYKGTIEMIYIDYSRNGAMNINLHFNYKGNVRKFTEYISNRAGEFTYQDKRTGKPKAMPGYALMNSLFMLVNNKPLSDQTLESKMVKIYDYNKKAEVPKEVQVFTELLNQPISIGILKVSEEKTTAESNYQQGTGEFRESNQIDKFFDPTTGQTSTEKDSGKDPSFLSKWKNRNDNKVKVKKAPKPGTPSEGKAGMPGQSNTNASGSPANPFDD